MERQIRNAREPRAGIVLIATLLSLMLIVGLSLTVQAAAVANAKALRALVVSQSYDMASDSIRELMRPVVAVSMINPEDPDTVLLNGTATQFEFQGSRYTVILQDVNGLVNPDLTPEPLTESLLPRDWVDITNAIRSHAPSLPLAIRASRAGAALIHLETINGWLSVLGGGIPTEGAIAENYNQRNLGISAGLVPEQQVDRAILNVSRSLPD